MHMARAAFLLSASLSLLPGVALAAAEELGVRITAPVDGARLDGMDLTRLVYEVRPGPKGDHVHVYVGGKEIGILRQLKGSYTLEPLPAGAQDLCIKVVNKAHVPIGVEQCVKVVVE
jgi:hypothetical protein